MLVLSRRLNEKILLPSIHTSVEVLDIKGDRVRLGIEAPASVTILREELAERQAAEGRSRRRIVGSAIGLARAISPSRSRSRRWPPSLEAAEAARPPTPPSVPQSSEFGDDRHRAGAAAIAGGQCGPGRSDLGQNQHGRRHQMTEQLELVIVPPASPRPSGESESPARVPPGAPKALLVEDDHNECELLAGFFRLAGYRWPRPATVRTRSTICTSTNAPT